MRRSSRKTFLCLFVILFLSVGLVSQAAGPQTAWVKRVVDGDTLLLTNWVRVRLIGVDCPEIYESAKLYLDAQRSGRGIKTIKALGQKAMAFTKSLVGKKQIRLEFDPKDVYLGRRGKYGKILAYVYLMDGTFVNAEIIEQGYGFVFTRFPFKYMKEFRLYEKMARLNKRGLWKGDIKL